MLRFFFYQLVFRFINYLFRNPYARKSLGFGCLALVVIWIMVVVLSVIIGFIGAVVIDVENWYTNTSIDPWSITLIFIVGIAGIGFATLFLSSSFRKKVIILFNGVRSKMRQVFNQRQNDSFKDKIKILDSPNDTSQTEKLIIIHRDDESQ